MQMGVALNAPPRRARQASTVNCARRGQPQILFASRAPPQRARWASTAIALEEPHQMLHASLAPTCQNVADQACNQRTLLLEALYAATTVHGRPLLASEERAQASMPRRRAPSARRVHFPLPVVLANVPCAYRGRTRRKKAQLSVMRVRQIPTRPCRAPPRLPAHATLGGRAPMAAHVQNVASAGTKQKQALRHAKTVRQILTRLCRALP